MKSLFAANICILLVAGSLASCRQQPAEVAGSVAFDTLTVDTICPLFHSYDHPACHLSIAMAKPEPQTPPETLQAIERFISVLPKDGSFEADANGSVESMVQAYVRAYIMQYLNEGHDAIGQHESESEEVADATTWMNYDEKVIGSVLFNADGLVSYQVVTDSFTGGAHGNKTIDNGVFSLATLSQLSLSDIFVDASLPELHAALRQKLMEQNGCQSLDELAEKGQFTAPAEIVATDNFFVNNEGITWTYDPYEIAPYSVGVVIISLTWDEVRPFMMPDTPVMTLAQR